MEVDLNAFVVTVGSILTALVGLFIWLVKRTYSHTIPRLASTFEKSMEAQRNAAARLVEDFRESAKEQDRFFQEVIAEQNRVFRDELKEAREDARLQRQEFRDELREQRKDFTTELRHLASRMDALSDSYQAQARGNSAGDRNGPM